MRKNNTIIIGAGISGLACARTLCENNEDFLIISEDIGGRILTSSDGKVNYGAFFVCSDYFNLLKYVKLKSQIRLRDFCFHEKDQSYIFFQPKLIKYSFQFLKVLKLLYKFRKKLRKLRKKTVEISQKKAIEKDKFLHKLYMQNASDFVIEKNIESGTKTYLSKGLYSTTFSIIKEMNAFSFLQFSIPIITPIYRFTFEKEKMIQPFNNSIVKGRVKNVIYKNGEYKIKLNKQIFQSKNIVLATQINWSKKIAGIDKTNLPVSTNMLHIKASPKKIISRKSYHLFYPTSNVQAIADLKDGTYLFYYQDKQPDLKNYFNNPKILANKFWDPVGTINGHNLIESYRGKNMYLIGDYNIAGLEESYITGIYAAKQIINSNIT
jgi:hypothetical protein